MVHPWEKFQKQHYRKNFSLFRDFSPFRGGQGHYLRVFRGQNPNRYRLLVESLWSRWEKTALSVIDVPAVGP
jgi:hypothetical protein